MNTDWPILYSFRRCPYAIRARMALRSAGVAVELREVVLGNKPPALIALSPKATVPVLRCADGQVIDESLAIMHWALRHNDPQAWLPAAEAPQNQQLVAQNDGPFKQALDRYKYADRYPGRSQTEYRGDAQDAMLAALEERLVQAAFLGGAAPCLSDVAIFPFVRQFAAVDAAWFETSPWPATRRWLRHWLESPQFTGVMDKARPWQPGQAPLQAFGRQ